MEAAGLSSERAKAKLKKWGEIQSDFLGQTGLKRQYGREEVPKIKSSKSIDMTNVPGNKHTATIQDISATMNYKELETYLEKEYNIKIKQDVKNLNFKSVKEVLTGVEHVIKDFPELGQVLSEVVITTDPRAVMSCSGERIKFNPMYFSDYNFLKQVIDSQKGFWVNNASPTSIGEHEAAHAVEWLLIQKNAAYTYDFERIYAWNKCDEAKAIVSEACRNIKKTAYGKGKKNSELITSISDYARENKSETMAEAFADVSANANGANPLSVEIKRLTIEKFKKYNGGAI